MRRWQSFCALAVLALAILACGSKAPEYVLRGWTVTPPPTSTPAKLPTTPKPGPTIIYIYPTAGWFTATVRVDQLEIRNGPGTKYPGDPSVYLSTGDVVEIMACKYDEQGEAWANIYWKKEHLFGWVAVTYRGAIFMWPMPERCTR